MLLEPTEVVALAAGEYHSMFVTASGTAFGCGLNDHGQLGVGITSTKYPRHDCGGSRTFNLFEPTRVDICPDKQRIVEV
jgi:alpha-tubulin suppressor-like RCC1 family protein